MSLSLYNSYGYVDPDNLYTYLGTSVLRNKWDERDASRAMRLEVDAVGERSIELFAHPIFVYDMSDIQDIHRHLFQDAYTWAGQLREVNISKSGKPFIPVQSFSYAIAFINELLVGYHAECHTRMQIITKLAEILDNLNYAHPFREGNGRTQREVIRVLAFMKGYRAEISLEGTPELWLFVGWCGLVCGLGIVFVGVNDLWFPVG